MSTSQTLPREDRRTRGIVLMLLAYLCFVGIDISAKFLGQTLPAIEVVFVRYLGHLLIVLAVVLPFQGAALFQTAAPGSELKRAIALFVTTGFNFSAVMLIPLAVHSAVFFVVPLVVAALAVPLLGERVGPRRWAAIAVGFIGVLIIIRPGMDAVPAAAFLSLAGAFSAAYYAIETRRLAGVDSPHTQQLYAALLASLVSMPFALWWWQWPTTAMEWLMIASIGFWGWAGHQLLTMAHRLAPASTLAPFVYSQIIHATIAGYLLFGDRPDLWVFVGAAIVTLSGLYVWLRERQLARAGNEA